ncbi:MAG: alpha/beta hydrolase-fold protein [Phycisphaerae bacterium]
MSIARIVAGSLAGAVLCVQVLAAAGEASPAASRDEEFLRSLFAMELDGNGSVSPAMGRLIDGYLASRPHDANSLRDLLRTEKAYEPIRPGWREESIRLADAGKTYDVPFTVHVPRSYRPEEPHALLLAAHGQGSRGSHVVKMMLRMLGPEAERYIIVAPTMPGPRHYSGEAYQEQAYLRPLQWARRRLNVDDDRICVSGYSMGGHCAWHLATLFPRHFAAAVAIAGVPWFQGAPHTANLYLENLWNLRLWSIWGELDRPAPPAVGQAHFNRAASERLKELGNTNYTGTELPGAGHEGSWPDRRAFAAFLAAGRRTSAPRKFAHFFHLEHHGRGYYLQAVQLAARPMRMDAPIRIKFNPRASDANGDEAAERYFARQLFKMWAELDRPKNTLAIRTSRVRTVRLYVTEGMFDLDRPVTVRFNARSWRGLVPPSPRCMLTHYAVERDAAALVYNEIDLPTVGGVLVRYKR